MPARPVGSADRTGAVIFFACLDLEQKSSFMDGHLLVLSRMLLNVKMHLFHFSSGMIPVF
jgi:hypothetical protein